MSRIVLALVLAALSLSGATAKEKSRPEVSPPAVTGTAAIDMDGPASGAYLAPEVESSSGTIAFHSASGLHAAYVGFGEDNNDTLYYAHCPSGTCSEDAGWTSVALDMPQGVKAQIAVTPEGRPRILGAGWKNEQANGTT